MYKVLVVDDEPMIRKGLVKIIQQQGELISEVQAAQNGTEALQLLEQEEPDFLFTDIRMPKLDGLELCRIVSERYPGVMMVVVTGYDDFDYARRSIGYGVKDYILKPITKKQIGDVLARLVSAARQREGAVVSMTRFNGWVHSLEESVWTLDESALRQQLDEVFAELSGSQLPFVQQKRHLVELCGMLKSRLNERDIYPVEIAFHEEGASNAKELRERVDAYVGEAVSLLRMKRKGKIKEPVEEAKLYIEEHLSRDFSLEEVADRIGLNASYFSQLFKQQTGETFAQYRIRRRMERAKQLLAVPHQKITNVSYEVGYADHPHFTKTFKKATGYTPSEYREMLGIEK